jgi:hypothetical protein
MLGVGLVTPSLGWAEEPARIGVPEGRSLAPQSKSANQVIAETIARHLRFSGQLRNYSVDVTFQDGVAELSGVVADQPQREEVLRIVQGVPGVERVRDHLRLSRDEEVRPAQANIPEPTPVVTPEVGSRGPVEPMPLNGGGGMMPYDVAAPRMPPYAWPTYAPYNNYSRVAVPQLYPYKSWPFIGPCYPFPKIPLGWRKVSLEWRDGHWWYGQVGNSHDWWRLRYW